MTTKPMEDGGGNAKAHYRQREAGYHSATWNASGAASGIYFARFTATDATGKVRLSKLNKLVLMK